METYRKFFSILKAHAKNKFGRLVNGDESWFILEFQNSTKWSVSRDDVPQKAKQQIGTQKFMLIAIWGIDEFHGVDLMTEQHSHNTHYLLSHILEPLLLAAFPDGGKPHSRQLSLHFDNYHVHRSKVSENFFDENYVIRVPHTPDSRNLTPSDVCLFWYMRAAREGQQFPGPEDFLTGSQGLLSEI
jgi:hypothetical protein